MAQQQAQVFNGDAAVVVEVALGPHGVRLAEVAQQLRQVLDRHAAVEGGVAVQGLLGPSR